MAVELLFKRGNTASNTAFTGKAGSITIDTELLQLRIHDGVTAGGHLVPRGADITAIQAQISALGIADIDGLQAALDVLSGDITTLQGRATTLEADVLALETNKLDASEKGVADGVATLDSNGRVPSAQLPDSVLGQVEYQGTWNAATDTPVLPDPTTVKGHYYVASAAGTYATLDFEIGDWVISDGVKWDRVNNTDAVRTVQGRTGDVVITKADVGLDQVDNTSDAAKPVSTAQQAALDLKADITYVDQQIAAAGTIDSIVGSGPITVDNTDPANPVVGIDDATTLTSGAMSAADKTKLDGIEAGAEANAVDSVNGQTGVVVLGKADVGLGSVEDYGVATQLEAEEAAVSNKYATPLSMRQFIESMGFVQDGNGDWSADQGEL